MATALQHPTTSTQHSAFIGVVVLLLVLLYTPVLDGLRVDDSKKADGDKCLTIEYQSVAGYWKNKKGWFSFFRSPYFKTEKKQQKIEETPLTPLTFNKGAKPDIRISYNEGTKNFDVLPGGATDGKVCQDIKVEGFGESVKLCPGDGDAKFELQMDEKKQKWEVFSTTKDPILEKAHKKRAVAVRLASAKHGECGQPQTNPPSPAAAPAAPKEGKKEEAKADVAGEAKPEGEGKDYEKKEDAPESSESGEKSDEAAKSDDAVAADAGSGDAA